MAGNWSVCGVCDFLKIRTPSEIWCSECDEGFCASCKTHHSVAKATRSHCTISIIEYQNLPADILAITQFCEKHTCPCCPRCIIENHNRCNNFASIDDVVKNVKTSSAFQNIEHILTELSENIARLRQDREQNLKSLKEERQNIEKEIKGVRRKVNAYLDKIQEDLVKELSSAEKKESQQIQLLLTSIENEEAKIKEVQNGLHNIKKHASDLQTFLALKQIEKVVAEKEEFLESVLGSNRLNHLSISCNIEIAMPMFSKAIQTFGAINVNAEERKYTLIRRKDSEAQTMFVPTPSCPIEQIELQAIMTFIITHIRHKVIVLFCLMVELCYVLNQARSKA